jgi:hypothetical protein
MSLPLVDNRGPSITVIGALSATRGLVHYEVFQGSNNTDTFSLFVTRLREKSKIECVVVMDNLATHKAKRIVGLFSDQF